MLISLQANEQHAKWTNVEQDKKTEQIGKLSVPETYNSNCHC